MAQRTTRNKIRWQADSVLDDLRHAQDHLIGMAALADDRSDFINEHLPQIIAGVEALTRVMKQVREGL